MNANIAFSDRDYQNATPVGPAGDDKTGVTAVDFLKRSKSWQSEILDTVCRYLRLPQGWDGYSGKPLRHETGMFALEVLNGMLGPSIPNPHIVPVGDGGVQIEWHENQFDIELYIAAPYDCELTVHDVCSGETQVTPLTSDFGPLATAVKNLVDYNRNLGPITNAAG
jgi:hypothetical protein